MSEKDVFLLVVAPAMVLVPACLAIRAGRQKRELEHLERMKALEMGQPVHGAGTDRSSRTWAGAAVAIAVPAITFTMSFLANMNSRGQEYTWVVSGVVGTIGIFAGLRLAGVESAQSGRLPSPSRAFKGTYDPDAYDVVSRRG